MCKRRMGFAARRVLRKAANRSDHLSGIRSRVYGSSFAISFQTFVRYIIPDFRSLYHSRPFEVLRSAVTGEGLHRGLSWLRDSSRFLTHDTYLGFHRCKREPDFMQLQVHRRHSQRKKAQKKCSITTKT